MTIHPREFLADYVSPAVEIYQTNPLLKHLAVHAISEMDNLAEVVAIHTQLGDRQILDAGEATRFRNDLRKREAVLGIVHDAHDSHKHGRLVRSIKKPDSKGASEGQRPETAKRAGFFVGVSPVGGPLSVYDVLVVRLNDGTEEEVVQLLFAGQQAWDREFRRLGL